MKKGLVSLVAAAALLGSVSLAAAGTVTTKGDTNISLGGFVQTYFDWANNQTNLGYQANPEFIKPGVRNTPAQTNFGTSSQFSRITLGISNPTEGITGVVEGDFFGGGANEQIQNKGNFRLRHAYVVKSFCQEGCNYTPWLLIGQTWDPLEILPNLSLNSIAGIAGQSWGRGVGRTSQIGFGVKFDLGSVKLNPAIYAANLANDSTFSNSNIINSKAPLSQRLQSPGFAVKLPVEFNTGLGAPADFYAGFEWQPMKLSGYRIKDSSQNAWMTTAALILPVYFVNLRGSVHYERGMTGFDKPLFGTAYAMPSFYINGDGSVQAVHGTSWTAQAQVDFNKLAQVPFTLALGYGQTVFSNYGILGDNDINVTIPLVRKMATMFANVNYHMTKSLALGLEYDRDRTNYVGAGNDGGSTQSANQVFLRGMYTF